MHAMVGVHGDSTVTRALEEITSDGARVVAM